MSKRKSFVRLSVLVFKRTHGLTALFVRLTTNERTEGPNPNMVLSILKSVLSGKIETCTYVNMCVCVNNVPCSAAGP